MQGPLTSQDLPKLEKHLLETLHVKTYLECTDTQLNARRKEQYHLRIQIQKCVMKCYKLILATLLLPKLNKEKSPLCQLVLPALTWANP